MNQQQLQELIEKGGPAIAIGLVLFGLVALVVMILYLLTLQKALSRCSPESRAMSPGLVWLMLIPCFNLVWQFFVVINIAKSLKAEFTKRGLPIEDKPGQTIGLIMCIAPFVSWIPFVGCIASIAQIVCFIMYWVKVAGWSKQIA
jgi:hypothetical protein